MRIRRILIVLALAASSLALADRTKKTHVVGKIVEGHADGDGMVLHVELGTADGVAKNARGEILVGDSGETKLPNGEIEVTEVVGEHRCVAKAKVKKLAGSHRVLVEAAPPAKQEKAGGGHVVSSYRDGDGMKLHIDKGEEDGIAVGTKGAVLVGESGATKMPDGEFHVVELVGKSKCIAQTKLKSLNRNTRVVFEH